MYWFVSGPPSLQAPALFAVPASCVGAAAGDGGGGGGWELGRIVTLAVLLAVGALLCVYFRCRKETEEDSTATPAANLAPPTQL